MFKYSFGYRSKVAYIFIGSVIGVISLLYTNYLARELMRKEQFEIDLWARGIALWNYIDPRSNTEREINLSIANNVTTIPAIMTDDYLRVIEYMNVPKEIIDNPAKLRSTIEHMCNSPDRQPIKIITPEGVELTVYYDDSSLLKSIIFFPYIQLGLIGIFISFAFITFRSSKQNEQNRVWVGMAKETAHQLGTPTSSLLGWIEYLKSMDIAPEATDEMSKDIQRLMKVANRFGKIGSTTQLSRVDVLQEVSRTVDYFQTRIPKNVTLRIEKSCTGELDAMINPSLFEWVMENLLKNALDALQGKGDILVWIGVRDKWAVVDVKDTGKGMTKSMYNKIFRPGFTTKTRGWGLGLSLSRRIVVDYHNGKIFVKESEVGKGTTFRIMIKKA
ncbi:Sensor histidine kinase [Mucinivorans hirudinis]|uniref:histidine kinase n=1 Tax=Mucinivorans hirudinis TaxID=1433126 RepID=A0A060RB16_9BACT|nr:Sensor histidine kinase [Mucinivorans hirudinis]